MSNKDLLKQAIAEAKTIREAAIANAKEALEETLTPHLKEMLAQKLQEMEEDDMNEEQERMNGSDQEDGTAGGDHGNIVKEAEEEEEAPEEGEEEKEEGEEEEDVNIEDMSVEDLKDLIRDIVHQEVEHEEEEMPGEEEAEPEHGDDMTSMDDSEEIDINELLAELEGMNEDDGYGKVKAIPGKGTHSYSLKPGDESGDTEGANDGYMEEEIEEGLGSAIKGGLDKFDKWIGNTSDKMSKAGQQSKTVQAMSKGVDKAQDKFQKSGLSTGWNKGAHLEEEEMEEGLGSAIKGGINKFDQWIASAQQKAKEAGQESEFVKALDKAVGGAQKAVAPKGFNTGAKYESVQPELNEALETINTLKNQLQEVNLLNAKLLYVNKVFKSNNLSEGQKVNVIAAFDKAETVKEVKLVFETVSKNVVAKPAAIKEHKSFASKATGNAQTTAPKEIISEVSEQVARWQKLAGIIKS